MRKLIFYMAVLVGLYIIAVHWGGFSHEIKEGFSGTSSLVKALQG
jgi:hypothetical protein